MIKVGSKVQWTETTAKGKVKIAGTVESLDGPRGRLIVYVPGEKMKHHIQPSFVTEVEW